MPTTGCRQAWFMVKKEIWEKALLIMITNGMSSIQAIPIYPVILLIVCISINTTNCGLQATTPSQESNTFLKSIIISKKKHTTKTSYRYIAFIFSKYIDYS